jgi:integrase
MKRSALCPRWLIPRFHSHLLLSIHTGIRMSEQYNLNWSRIDFERRQMYLPRTKNGEPCDVPLNGTAISALERLRKESDRSLVLPNAESPAGGSSLLLSELNSETARGIAIVTPSPVD